VLVLSNTTMRSAWSSQTVTFPYAANNSLQMEAQARVVCLCAVNDVID
jgi:hypothetical protein